jgi:hypothetical protein
VSSSQLAVSSGRAHRQTFFVSIATIRAAAELASTFSWQKRSTPDNQTERRALHADPDNHQPIRAGSCPTEDQRSPSHTVPLRHIQGKALLSPTSRQSLSWPNERATASNQTDPGSSTSRTIRYDSSLGRRSGRDGSGGAAKWMFGRCGRPSVCGNCVSPAFLFVQGIRRHPPACHSMQRRYIPRPVTPDVCLCCDVTDTRSQDAAAG